MAHPDDPEDRDPGLARQRTRMAWLRTAIAFGALGFAVLKVNIAAGTAILPMAPLTWLTVHFSRRVPPGRARPGHIALTAAAIVVVALVALAVVLLGHGRSPGFHVPVRR